MAANPGASVAAPLWPLVEISVSGLFGDRAFGLRLDSKATVLTGENGSGKSTLLRATDFLAKERWTELSLLPFEELGLKFHDGTTLSAINIEDGVEFRSEEDSWSFDRETAAQFEPQMLQQLRRANLRLRSGAGGQQALLRHQAMRAEGGEFEHIVPPKWVIDFISRLTTKYISARRLEHRLRPDPRNGAEDTPTPVVEQYADQLGDRMRHQLSRYAAESRQHERNLPGQIVQAMQTDTESAEELARDVDRLQGEVRDLADSLARVGLLYEDPEQQLAQYPGIRPRSS
jgi:energy-coupling factor transporter ATP-binding protein EcfA2